jgi:hypothetical protein
MTKAEYLKKHLGITSKLTEKEMYEIIRIILIDRDLEFGGESRFATIEAKELGIKTDWR